MNPELQRNLWLELSVSRVLLMAGVLALILAIAWFGAPEAQRPQALQATAYTLYGLIVALWGSFKAGRSVSDEIRERTWDFQRLSALSPAAMTLGKLFGATAYCWFGGAIVLGAAFAGRYLTDGLSEAAIYAGQLLLLGVIAHAVALSVSLAVVRRGRGRDRVDAFIYTIAGYVAFQSMNEFAGGEASLMQMMSRVANEAASADSPRWMGLAIDNVTWTFAVLAVVAAWAVATAWRLMRVELQAPANPLWYPLFLLVPVALLAGRSDTVLAGFVTAYFLVHVLVLLTLLLEPKDFVAWRLLLAGRGKRGRHWPATITGLGVAFLLAVGVAIAAPFAHKIDTVLLGFAAFAFLLRETAIFAFYHLGVRQRRGDFAALVTIGLLCFAGPAIMELLRMHILHAAFFVDLDGDSVSHVISIAAGLVQAALFGVAAQGRWGARVRGLAAA
jgi:hypothetical protein